MNDIQIVVASWPSRDGPVAELWRGEDYIGDVHHDGSGYSVDLTPMPGTRHLRLESLVDALQLAKERLEPA